MTDAVLVSPMLRAIAHATGLGVATGVLLAGLAWLLGRVMNRSRSRRPGLRMARPWLLALLLVPSLAGFALQRRHEGAVVAATLACREDALCRSRGLCGARILGLAYEHECVAVDAAHCRRSSECRERGRCDHDRANSSCAKLTDASCRQLADCPDDGACTNRAGRCVQGSDADCRQSQWCRREGRCSLRDDACRPVTDRDCEGSKVCREDGRCVASQGRCIATEASCAESGLCRRQGRCRPADEDDHYEGCVASSSEDCRSSLACQEHDRCVLSDHQCRTIEEADQSCARSTACGADGVCRTDQRGGCHATVDAECRESTGCFEYGLCSARDGHCVATADGDCRHSNGCVFDQRCKLAGRTCTR